MKIAFFAALGLAIATALAPIDADARRMGGGKSFGMQRNMPQRTAPNTPPPQPATPAQQGAAGQQAAPARQPTQAGAPNAAAAQAAAPKRSWMGPLAGLAAGLGLAALMSHLGLGEEFASFMMLLLLAFVALAVIRMVLARRQPAQAASASYRMAGAGGAQVSWPKQSDPEPVAAAAGASARFEPAAPEAPAAAPAAPIARAFVPAAFDSEGFARTAKMIFIRLQAANDAGDLDDLRAFTTPEVFAELSMDLRERGGKPQHTEVLDIDSEVLDVAEEDGRQIVSVRMRGQVREEAGAAPVAVDEVWHLARPADGSRNWAIAGIEQWQGAATH
ncbi:MAG: 39S ribosomal protein L45 [Burkholderiales bacterium]|nr:39S ribosomal protein L45 [Burkholderiales bacterium]